MHSCSAMDRHYATLGVPYYRVSRIFMSRIFSVPLVFSARSCKVARKLPPAERSEELKFVGAGRGRDINLSCADPRVMLHLPLAGACPSVRSSHALGSLIAALQMHRYYAGTDRLGCVCARRVSAVMQLGSIEFPCRRPQYIAPAGRRALTASARLKATLLCVIGSSLFVGNLFLALHFNTDRLPQSNITQYRR